MSSPCAAGDGAKLGNLPATAKRGRAGNARFTRMKHGLHRRYNGEKRSAFPQKHEPPRGEPAKAVPLRGPLYLSDPERGRDGVYGHRAKSPGRYLTTTFVAARPTRTITTLCGRPSMAVTASAAGAL